MEGSVKCIKIFLEREALDGQLSCGMLKSSVMCDLFWRVYWFNMCLVGLADSGIGSIVL